MNKILLAGSALAVLALCGTAGAADLGPRYKAPPPVVAPAYDWSGWYIGVNVGGAWGHTVEDFSPGVPNTTGQAGSGGAVGGGQIGVNWQVGDVVWGLEADANAASVTSNQVNGAVPQFGVGGCVVDLSCEVKNDFLATVRARLGYSLGWAMPYITGGLAVGNVEAFFDDGGGVTSTLSKTQLGWTAGTGFEFALGAGWTAKVEYLFVDLGSFSGVEPISGTTVTVRDEVENIARVGLNYKFNWAAPVVAKY